MISIKNNDDFTSLQTKLIDLALLA